MAQQTTTITVPKWIQKNAAETKPSVKDLLRTFAFLKMKEYERQTDAFRQKYKTDLIRLEKKIKTGKKENPELWDDYIVWKGLNLAYQKWVKRYKNRG
ncbi:MAG: hypothetical protein AAB579_00685 [Patescibacteria group bacterium]